MSYLRSVLKNINYFHAQKKRHRYDKCAAAGITTWQIKHSSN